MTGKKVLVVSLITTTILGNTAAMAELSANVSLTSNYVSKGTTQTDDNPAIQGGLDYVNANGLYVGTWGSTVNKGLEIDLYAGYMGAVKSFGYDIGYLSYNYTDKAFSENSTEIYIGGIYKNFNLYYSIGDYSLSDYTYIDFRADFAIKDIAIIKLHYGLIEYDVIAGDYYDYSLAISKDFNEYDLSLTYTSDEFSDKEEVFVTISKTFGL